MAPAISAPSVEVLKLISLSNDIWYGRFRVTLGFFLHELLGFTGIPCIVKMVVLQSLHRHGDRTKRHEHDH